MQKKNEKPKYQLNKKKCVWRNNELNINDTLKIKIKIKIKN